METKYIDYVALLKHSAQVASSHYYTLSFNFSQ